MDYERKELVDWIRGIYQNLDEADKQDALRFFPELRESEDEKIRRTLAEYFGPGAQLDLVRGVPIQKIRDWLEKQKEQKPMEIEEIIRKAKSEGRQEVIDNPEYYQLQKPEEWQKPEWSEEDEERLKSVIHRIEVQFAGNLYGEGKLDVDWLKSLRPQPKQEWSEEDERKVSSLLAMLTTMRQLNSHGSLVGVYSKRDREKKFDEIENWLKSLRPSWKPSEEQMLVLGRFLNFLHEVGSPDFGLMDSLLGELKEL